MADCLPGEHPFALSFWDGSVHLFDTPEELPALVDSLVGGTSGYVVTTPAALVLSDPPTVDVGFTEYGEGPYVFGITGTRVCAGEYVPGEAAPTVTPAMQVEMFGYVMLFLVVVWLADRLRRFFWRSGGDHA